MSQIFKYYYHFINIYLIKNNRYKKNKKTKTTIFPVKYILHLGTLKIIRLILFISD